MSHNMLSDKSLLLLADGLRENSTLTDLFLTHNDLSSPNGMHLVGTLGNK